MLLFYIFMAVALLVLGLLVRKGKNYEFLAGYDRMSDEEKREENIACLAKRTGVLLYALSFLATICAILQYLLPKNNATAMRIAAAYFMLFAFSCLVYFFGSKKNTKKKESFVVSIIVVVAMALMSLISALIFYLSFKV